MPLNKETEAKKIKKKTERMVIIEIEKKEKWKKIWKKVEKEIKKRTRKREENPTRKRKR